MADYIEINSNISPQPNMMQRSAASPLDRSSMFSSYEDAVEYALGLYKKDGERRASAHDSRKLAGTSYVGQIITVYEDGVITHYTIKEDRSLDPVDKKNANISELTNDAGYITSDAISGKADTTAVTSSIESAIASETARTEGAYAAINHTHDQYSPTGHTHDDRYYTESEVDTLLAGKAASGHTHDYATTQDIQDAIDAIKIPEVPTSNTAFTNDAGYLTEQDITGKADTSALTEYASTAFTEATYVKSLEGYATEQYVDDAISGINIPEVPTSNTAFTNDAGYITSDAISGKADTSAVTSSIEAAISAETARTESTYLKDHQDISGKADVSALTEYATTAFTEATYVKSLEGYATEQYVNDAVSGKSDSDHTHDDRYYTETEINEQLADKADVSAVTSDIATAIASETARTESTYLKEHQSLDGYATEEWVEQQGFLTAHQDISGKADASAVTASIEAAIQAEVERADQAYLTQEDITGKADTTAVTESIANAVSGKVDTSALTDYATTAFTEQTYLKEHQDISGKADASAVTADIASAIASETGRTESTYQKTLTPGANIDITNGTISVTGLPTSNTAFTNDAGYLVATDIANKADATGVTAEIASAVTDMATQTWVGQQGFAAASAISEYTIEELATPESGAQTSYVLKKDGVKVGATINIPVAQVLDGAEIKTVTSADKAEGGIFENDAEFEVGDKYMDFDFNGNHQYLNVKSLITDYGAGDAIAINGSNQISVKLATAQTQSVASGTSKNFATIEESGLRVGGMDTDVTVTTSDIRVVGGPISANNVFANNVIPAGTSVQEILTKLLCKEMNPTTTKPSVSVSITQGGKHEVGTEVSPSYTVNFNRGSYTYGPDTNVAASGYEVSDTFGNTADTATGSLTAFTVGDSTSYKVSAKASYSAGSMPVTNLGNDYPSGQIQASSTTLANSSTITGYRRYFYGSTTSVTPGNSWTSADVRALSNKSTNAASSGEFSMSIPDNTKQVVVAFPASSNLSLTKVLDGNASWSNITGNFELFTVNVEGANGYTAVAYKVYIWTPSATLQANTYKITLG